MAIADSFVFETGVADVILDVVGNDVDADQDALMAVILSQPENGQIVMLADGNLGYTPNPGFIGTDQFTYVPSDGAATLGLLVTVDLTVEAPGGVPSEATGLSLTESTVMSTVACAVPPLPSVTS